MAIVEKGTSKSLLDVLVEAKLLSAEQAKEVREIQQRGGRKLLDILLERELVEAEPLLLTASLYLEVPFVNLKKQEPEASAIKAVPEWVCRKYRVIPLQATEDALRVAMEDPSDLQAVDYLAALTRKRIEPILSLPKDVQESIDRSYRMGGEIATELLRVPTASSRRQLEEGSLSAETIAEAPVVRAVDMLIRQAARDRASDIHIEPQETELRVRIRIDGILQETMALPMTVHPALVSRLKIIGGMNIAETRRPQDGQITFKDGSREIDVRVATAPTVWGEMVVLRLLDKSFAFRPLPQLGFLPQALEAYQNLLKLPFGMVLISGPTGAGKTTTLYGSVNYLDNVGRNIITIEDPVEYRFARINQMQVNPAAGITFASGLRATMRLDPNIILVGEIRDSETAKTAIQAALTGHLVLSSVHANDTVGTIFRLIDLGVEPFLVSAAVAGVVAQRMVRLVCPNCSTMTAGLPGERLAYEREMNEEREQFVYGTGCHYCAWTGYRGRKGIFEVMVVSETIRRMILTGAGADEIRSQALKEGMVSLWRDGMLNVKQGITTPYEVISNVFSLG